MTTDPTVPTLDKLLAGLTTLLGADRLISTGPRLGDPMQMTLAELREHVRFVGMVEEPCPGWRIVAHQLLDEDGQLVVGFTPDTHPPAACPLWLTKRSIPFAVGDLVKISLHPRGRAEGVVAQGERAFCPTCERMAPVIMVDGRAYGGTVQRIVEPMLPRGRCDECAVLHTDLRACGRDTNGDADAPDLCPACRRAAGMAE